jgi:3-oxoacyl-[acyl-carrier protein] reductase
MGGRILLTSSVSARIAVYQHTLYAASKAAVSAMVLNLAPELAERGIAINAVAPGGPRPTWRPNMRPATPRPPCAA